MKLLILALFVVIIAGNALAETGKQSSVPGMSGLDISGEFFPAAIGTVYEPREKIAPITIPKKWRLVSVSAGEGDKESNLWFQDVDGTVYFLHGFIKNGQFVMDKNVQKIIAK